MTVHFDRQTGDLLIADVGQGSREEVDFQPAGSAGGQNYCWKHKERTLVFDPSVPCTTGVPTAPVIEYAHTGGNCPITGGYRSRGAQFPALAGLYFYGDFCSGRIWGARQAADGTWSTTEMLDTSLSISTFGEDEDGALYRLVAGAGDRGGEHAPAVGVPDSRARRHRGSGDAGRPGDRGRSRSHRHGAVRRRLVERGGDRDDHGVGGHGRRGVAGDAHGVRDESGDGACLGPPTPTVAVAYAGGTNRSFAVFVRGSGIIPFDPGVNRIFVRFEERAVTRGATSVAVRTQ